MPAARWKRLSFFCLSSRRSSGAGADLGAAMADLAGAKWDGIGARAGGAPEGAELTARAVNLTELGALGRPVDGCRCMETELGAVSVCIGGA